MNGNCRLKITKMVHHNKNFKMLRGKFTTRRGTLFSKANLLNTLFVQY